MTNIYTCFRDNKTSAKYGLASPAIEDYLNVNRNFAYDGDNRCEEMCQLLATQTNW